VKIDILTRFLIFSSLIVLLLPLTQAMPSAQSSVENDNRSNLIVREKHNALSEMQALRNVQDRNLVMGAYIPDSLHLEDMKGKAQDNAIQEFLSQGFNEYFFVMDSFDDAEEMESTERLLDSADSTKLKIIIILLPPSEGGPLTNYDWKGWIHYFNYLKARHPSSFDGFAIDDFNWISTRKDTMFWRNIDFMVYTNLTTALELKRNDVKFYPVIYFEGLGLSLIENEFGKFVDSLILVSASYYNVSNLERNILSFKEIFPDKPTRYIVYPTITYNYTKQGYEPPSDRLVMATLSVATRLTDGIIIWHKIDSPIVQDYLKFRDNIKYLDAIHVMETLQISGEKDVLSQATNNQTVAGNLSNS